MIKSNYFIFFVSVLLIGCVSGSQAHYFTQKLDHYNPLDSRTFQQKYYVFDDNYKPGGPLFFVINGEDPLDVFWETYGLPMELSANHSALVVSIEHRYYGDSVPFGFPLNPDNLAYLNAQQALSDLVTFREHVFTKYSLGKETKVFGFGCSYSGALSAWFRTKFPHLIDGVFSGSSPVEAVLNYTSFNTLVENVLEGSCGDSVVTAVQQAETMLATENGRAEIQRMFNICSPIDTDWKVQLFKWQVRYQNQLVVQYQNPPNWPLTNFCNSLEKASDKLETYGELLGWWHGACLELSVEALFPPDGSCTWYWQKASEFAYYKPTPVGSKMMFQSIDLDFYDKLVQKIFGKKITPQVQETNRYFGGKNVDWNGIIFVNSVVEPWSLLSITDKSLNSDKVQVVTYDDAGHCAPYHYYGSQMPEGVLNARKKIDEYIYKIVNQ
ncbi:protease s28 pro-x carboxypeptidase-related [Anaeramoeba flamelloides]|uniref:Protease s28 pro-x carboxypeptidase-related n=1 Tax=Anaeramoeba flamelloides TaxID=1746091 RepID=A0AAV7Z0R3_9EUKA|nr:protease s28 pro-x carboxypeptidase-related [Anaeramoeba flamelloides]